VLRVWASAKSLCVGLQMQDAARQEAAVPGCTQNDSCLLSLPTSVISDIRLMGDAAELSSMVTQAC
jgi:hypothetical protein